MDAQKLCLHGNEAKFVNLLALSKMNPYSSTCCEENFDKRYLIEIENFENCKIETEEYKMLLAQSRENKNKHFEENLGKIVSNLKVFIDNLNMKFELLSKNELCNELDEQINDSKQNCEFLHSIWKEKKDLISFSSYKTNLKAFIDIQLHLKESISQNESKTQELANELDLKSKELEMIYKTVLEKIDNILSPKPKLTNQSEEKSESKPNEENSGKPQVIEKVKESILSTLTKESIISKCKGYSYDRNSFDVLSAEKVCIRVSMIKKEENLFYPLFETFCLESSTLIQSLSFEDKDSLFSKDMNSQIFCISNEVSELNKIIYFNQNSKFAVVFYFEKSTKLIQSEFDLIDIGFQGIINFKYSRKHNAFMFLLSSGNGVMIVDSNSLQLRDEIKGFSDNVWDSSFYDEDNIAFGEEQKYHFYNLQINSFRALKKCTNYKPYSIEIVRSENLMITGECGNLRIYNILFNAKVFLILRKEIKLESTFWIRKIEALDNLHLVIVNQTNFLNILNIESGEVQRKEYKNIKNGIFDFKFDQPSNILILKDGYQSEKSRFHFIK